MSRRFTSKLNAILNGTGLGLMLGCACVSFVMFSQTILMGEAIHPDACSPGAVVMTTFTPDIHC